MNQLSRLYWLVFSEIFVEKRRDVGEVGTKQPSTLHNPKNYVCCVTVVGDSKSGIESDVWETTSKRLGIVNCSRYLIKPVMNLIWFRFGDSLASINRVNTDRTCSMCSAVVIENTTTSSKSTGLLVFQSIQRWVPRSMMSNGLDVGLNVPTRCRALPHWLVLDGRSKRYWILETSE